ncbi:Bud site selection protein, Revert to axial protein 1 [Puccinia graminis f. sp. tritici]|uniref:RGS domain-containing protein n=2 Tax=Puccinia graminis f. sp. tritici TaxID=56615 RepID=E3KC24_PUCGT|nr:uncharacterized protein PGTG_08055 [Puccinia graminis f. sp. tritici CRL 75-36-700-3]EFP81806.2 hypothetical protein PGTG_08055 [Puccinia graminis f. sp. tritici CRL 75-36-700-3]KAA1099526.1 Bud site selection protein, Revert to axial protein 1 [Puccinia graminis f. sp. tritici]KAA1103791.1 Bud site selection protein, Revert to axial protein 1 [Puccinia graminis f. sp. tritici]KAA1117560.1 Bud site selection protein, Revert to axial protein 1 [Puccinia graminis f. sp. tritici]
MASQANQQHQAKLNRHSFDQEKSMPNNTTSPSHSPALLQQQQQPHNQQHHHSKEEAHHHNTNINIITQHQDHHHPPQQQQQQRRSASHTQTQNNRLSALPPSMARNRLPTLQEVLARQTRPPVDLYCFYLYLQREKAEDSLDFWLDAQQHENLCRAYFKDLRRSAVDLRDEWPAYYQRACTRGSVYNPINGISRQSRLMNETQNFFQRPNAAQSIDSSRVSQQGMPSPKPPHVSPALRALFPHDKIPDQDDDLPVRPLRQSSTRARTPIQPVIPRSSAITRTDLIASAERIYYRYLLSGAEKEIYLPSSLRIHNFPINSTSLPHAGSPDYDDEASFLAMVPDLFVSQKEYIFRSMERDTFPRFLRAKAFGNLTPMSSIIRLSVGLVAIWIGLSVALSLIFLDIHPRAHRLWSMIPLSIGAVGVLGHFYELDPVLLLFNRSETTFFRTLSIKEKYVQKILRGRAVWVVVLSSIIVACLTCILVFVPGHRL